MELIFYLALAGLLLFGLGSALRFSDRTVGTDLLKAGGFPIIVIVLSLIALAFLTVKYVLRCRKEHQPVFSSLGIHSKVIALAGVITVYVILMNFIGFIISTLVFTFVNPIIMGYKKYRLLAIFSVVLTVLIILIFGRIFYVPLPRGLGILRELSFYIY